MWITKRWILAILLAVGVLPTVAIGGDSWRVGAASAKITPETFMWMAGYGGRDRPAEATLTDLWAKALVLEDEEGRRAVLISLDLVGIDRKLSHRICSSLHERYSLERNQIAICNSHTHSGPVVGQNLAPLHYLVVDDGQQKLIDQYARTLEQTVVEVVGEAIEQVEPARLSWGSGTATFAVNRRNNRESEVPQARVAGKLLGPVDHDVPVLAARGADGHLSAVVFGYACHATVLSSYQWSGDYPGFAQIELENIYPDCVVLFFAGCGGDQNPLPRRSVGLAEHYGRRLANAVDQVLLTTKMNGVSSSLRATYHEINLPFDKLPTREAIEKDAADANPHVASRARMLLAQMVDGQPLASTYPYPVATWRLGNEVQFVLLGGEVVVDYALRLKTELSGTRTWVAGYTNDVMAYIPSRRVLREGGSEGGGAMVYYGLSTFWAPQVEEMIIREVHAQLDLDFPYETGQK